MALFTANVRDVANGPVSDTNKDAAAELLATDRALAFQKTTLVRRGSARAWLGELKHAVKDYEAALQVHAAQTVTSAEHTAEGEMLKADMAAIAAALAN